MSAERMSALVAELRERTALVAAGGGERALERHRSRGKLPVRERIDRLVVYRENAVFLLQCRHSHPEYIHNMR